MNDVSIFVCCHRPAPIRKSSVLLPIQVGSALGTEKLDMIGDSEGENISDKNRFYCERRPNTGFGKTAVPTMWGCFITVVF